MNFFGKTASVILCFFLRLFQGCCRWVICHIGCGGLDHADSSTSSPRYKRFLTRHLCSGLHWECFFSDPSDLSNHRSQLLQGQTGIRRDQLEESARAEFRRGRRRSCRARGMVRESQRPVLIVFHNFLDPLGPQNHHLVHFNPIYCLTSFFLFSQFFLSTSDRIVDLVSFLTVIFCAISGFIFFFKRFCVARNLFWMVFDGRSWIIMTATMAPHDCLLLHTVFQWGLHQAAGSFCLKIIMSRGVRRTLWNTRNEFSKFYIDILQLSAEKKALKLDRKVSYHDVDEAVLNRRGNSREKRGSKWQIEESRARKKIKSGDSVKKRNKTAAVSETKKSGDFFSSSIAACVLSVWTRLCARARLVLWIKKTSSPGSFSHKRGGDTVQFYKTRKKNKTKRYVQHRLGFPAWLRCEGVFYSSSSPINHRSVVSRLCRRQTLVCLISPCHPEKVAWWMWTEQKSCPEGAFSSRGTAGRGCIWRRHVVKHPWSCPAASGRFWGEKEEENQSHIFSTRHNQSINQSIHPSINQSIDPSINQPNNQSTIGLLIKKWSKWSIDPQWTNLEFDEVKLEILWPPGGVGEEEALKDIPATPCPFTPSATTP